MKKELFFVVATLCTVCMVGGQSAALQQRLREAGVKVEWVPLESLIDGYGAVNKQQQTVLAADTVYLCQFVARVQR